MSTPICPYCGGRVTLGGDSTRHWHFCDACSEALKPTWPGSGVSPAKGGGQHPIVSLLKEEWRLTCLAVLDKAYTYPEYSPKEKEWLALERKIREQFTRS